MYPQKVMKNLAFHLSYTQLPNCKHFTKKIAINEFLLGFPTEITYFYEWVSYFRDVKLPKFKS